MMVAGRVVARRWQPPSPRPRRHRRRLVASGLGGRLHCWKVRSSCAFACLGGGSSYPACAPSRTPAHLCAMGRRCRARTSVGVRTCSAHINTCLVHRRTAPRRPRAHSFKPETSQSQSSDHCQNQRRSGVRRGPPPATAIAALRNQPSSDCGQKQLLSSLFPAAGGRVNSGPLRVRGRPQHPRRLRGRLRRPCGPVPAAARPLYGLGGIALRAAVRVNRAVGRAE